MSLQDLYTSFWEMEEATAATRVDSKGSNNLTDINSVAQATGKVGFGADFESGSSQRMVKASNASVKMGDIDCFWSAWIKPESLAADQGFISKWTIAGTREYTLYYENAPNRFGLYVSSNGTTVTSIAANNLGAPSTGVWYFLVGWHDSVANTLNICGNNGAVNSVSYSSGIFTTDSSDLYVGSLNASQFPVDGIMDQVGFGKNVIPSAAAITALYNNGNGLSWAQMADPFYNTRFGRQGVLVRQAVNRASYY